MNEFDEAYEKILTANMFYEQVGYRRRTKNMRLALADEFYSSIIHVNDEDEIVILESHQDAQFKRSLVDKVFNARDYEHIDANEVFRRCSATIRSNYAVDRDIPICIFSFSFSRNPKMICTLFSYFNIQFSLENGSLKDRYDYETNRFTEECSGDSGECVDLGSCALLLFNTDKKTKTTVVHELYHYLQIILKKEKHSLERSKFKEIKELRLSVDDLEYLLDDYEFETHIKVDLVDQLEEMYWRFYKKDFPKRVFIDKFISAVKKNPLNVVSAFFNKLIDMKHSDTTQLRLFAVCFKIEDKKYALDAVRWLREAFQ